MMGNRMKELRKKKGLTQADVAQALAITDKAYSQYERGEREPEFRTLLKVADFFETSVDYLLMHDSTASERVISEKYEALDEHGKEVVARMQEAVDCIIEMEYRRCTGAPSKKEITVQDGYTFVRKASRSADDKPVQKEKIKNELLEKIRLLEDVDENL